MQPTSPTARTVAHRLLARARATSDPGHSPRDAVAAGEWVSRVLADKLSRWFGPYGYHALLTRALTQARDAHPVLAPVRVRGPADPVLEGLSEVAGAHGNRATEEAIAAILAGVVELLGRLIGEDMAVNLLEQAVPSSASDTARVAREESES